MTEDTFRFIDALGPAKIVQIYEPSVALKAIVVIDNVAAGPAIGGSRMAVDVSVEECFRLARAMTLKNAAMGLPHGGGKSVIFADPKMPLAQKETLIRGFARAIRYLDEYIVGPDMGTNETCMAWINDEIGRSVGLPREIGGIPLDEIGATGWGVCQAAEVAAPYCDLDLNGARVVVQGFGAVGQFAALYLAQRGAVLVAASDSSGTIYHQDGLDVEALRAHKLSGQSVAEYTPGKKLNRDEIIDVVCDIWIPAARPDVINQDNVQRLNTKLVLQGANVPMSDAAEQILTQKGILYVPDIIANAGGVICAAMEYQGATESAVFDAITSKVRDSTQLMLEQVKQRQQEPRQAANTMALQRVNRAMALRRHSLMFG